MRRLLEGLVSAALSGAANALAGVAIDPVNIGPHWWKIASAGALIGVVNYFRNNSRREWTPIERYKKTGAK